MDYSYTETDNTPHTGQLKKFFSSNNDDDEPGMRKAVILTRYVLTFQNAITLSLASPETAADMLTELADWLSTQASEFAGESRYTDDIYTARKLAENIRAQ